MPTDRHDEDESASDSANDAPTHDAALSDLQLALMQVLWARDEASTADVAEALRGERVLAHTTVATLLTRLEKRGLVAARRDGRALLYRPLVSQGQVQRQVVAGLLDKLFGGQPSALLSHLLTERQIGDADLAEMRALLKRKGAGRA